MKALLLPMIAAVAACATTRAPDAPAEPYRALGTEPFWSIAVADGRMTFESPEGGFSVQAPAVRETGDGRIYRTRRITLHIRHGECSDGMSDRRYPETVRASVDGRELRGCGGAALPPQRLADTNWAIVEIAGEAVTGARYAIQFGQDRLSGAAGCNRFSGGYTVAGDVLTPGAIAATRMACAGPGGAHERRAFAILSGPVTIRFHPDGDILVLTGAGGTIRLERSY